MQDGAATTQAKPMRLTQELEIIAGQQCSTIIFMLINIAHVLLPTTGWRCCWSIDYGIIDRHSRLQDVVVVDFAEAIIRTDGLCASCSSACRSAVTSGIYNVGRIRVIDDNEATLRCIADLWLGSGTATYLGA